MGLAQTQTSVEVLQRLAETNNRVKVIEIELQEIEKACKKSLKRKQQRLLFRSEANHD